MAGGRPTKYKPEYVEQATKLCLLGATDDQLADFFKVAISTIYQWRIVHPEFSDAQKDAKAVADARVERSLYQRAIGYEADAVKIFMPSGATEPVYAPYRERVAPDTTAMIFWLKNRRPAEWRDKQETVHTHRWENMTDDELDAAIEQRLAGAVAARQDRTSGLH